MADGREGMPVRLESMGNSPEPYVIIPLRICFHAANGGAHRGFVPILLAEYPQRTCQPCGQISGLLVSERI